MAEYKDITPLKKQISDVKKAINSPNSDYMTGYICALSVTEGIIAELPTADVVEVKHSTDIGDMSNSEEWYGAVHICGECGCNWMTLYIEDAKRCPRCSAKMDGRRDT